MGSTRICTRILKFVYIFLALVKMVFLELIFTVGLFFIKYTYIYWILWPRKLDLNRIVWELQVNFEISDTKMLDAPSTSDYITNVLT